MKYLIYIFIAFAFTSCLKSDPEDLVTLPPRFTVEGMLDANPFSMEAGVNGMYLFTDYIEYGYGTVVYNANYSDFENPNSEGLSFHLIVKGDANNSAGDLEEHLSAGNVNLNPESSDFGNFIFEVTSADSPWIWSDGLTTSTASNFTIENSPGLVSTISCTSTGPSCFTSTIIQAFVNLDCDNLNYFGAINLEHGDNNTLRFIPPANAENFETLIWSIEGNDYITSGATPLTIPDLGMDEITVVLTTTGSNGNAGVLWLQTFTGVTLNCPFPQITAGFNQIAEPLMRVEYRDGSGNRYSSVSNCDNFFIQPVDAYFTIHSFEPYAENEAGDPSFEITFSTKILLFDVSSPIPGNTPIWLEIDHGNMAFSYPQ